MMGSTSREVVRAVVAWLLVALFAFPSPRLARRSLRGWPSPRGLASEPLSSKASYGDLQARKIRLCGLRQCRCPNGMLTRVPRSAFWF